MMRVLFFSLLAIAILRSVNANVIVVVQTTLSPRLLSWLTINLAATQHTTAMPQNAAVLWDGANLEDATFMSADDAENLAFAGKIQLVETADGGIVKLILFNSPFVGCFEEAARLDHEKWHGLPVGSYLFIAMDMNGVAEVS